MMGGALLGVAVLLASGGLYGRRTRDFDRIHPELRSPLSRFRSPSMGPRLLRFSQWGSSKATRCVAGVDASVHHLARADGSALPVHVYRPRTLRSGSPAMLYTHGGGMIMGSAPGYHGHVSALARDLDMIVVSADYRLAPAHPYPAALDDIYDTYDWLARSTDLLEIDPARIVVAGESAGGGLTAALCLRIRDAGLAPPRLQLLAYPMLDDRTGGEPPGDLRGQLIWTPTSNRFAWQCYLGDMFGTQTVPEYAAPARRADLSGLPPAWIGVGTLDLFHDENIEYARQLTAAGIPCAFEEVEGAFHGFDLLYPRTRIARAFREAMLEAIRAAMHQRNEQRA